MNVREVTLRAFELHNFKLFRKERLTLHPEFTVLVGQNDVGKSILVSSIFLYGEIQRSGFRGPLSDDLFTTSGDHITKFVTEWEIDGVVWMHRIVLDANAPEERIECGERYWSWNPKDCVLTTEQGQFSAKNLDRYQTIGLIETSAWKLDTNIDESIYLPLEISKHFRTPMPYLFEPSALGRPASLEIQRPRRNGHGWALWLQEIINRRNEDLTQLESAIQKLFPFFDRVRVREERIRIEREVSVLGQRDTSSIKAGLEAHDREAIADFQDTVLDFFRNQQSTREVFIELKSVEPEGERARIDANNVSSGLLLALAHFSLVYADEAGKLLLLEEPENGLNAKITLAMMRSFLQAVRQRRRQLILTTHNAWWLDLVPESSIRVLRRDAEGAHIHEPDPALLNKMREELDIYPSELMSAHGPEGLLAQPELEDQAR